MQKTIFFDLWHLSMVQVEHGKLKLWQKETSISKLEPSQKETTLAKGNHFESIFCLRIHPIQEDFVSKCSENWKEQNVGKQCGIWERIRSFLFQPIEMSQRTMGVCQLGLSEPAYTLCFDFEVWYVSPWYSSFSLEFDRYFFFEWNSCWTYHLEEQKTDCWE